MQIRRLFAGSSLLLGLAALPPCVEDERPKDFVDGFIDAGLATSKSADSCTDLEFLRRVTLDLTGVVPHAADARDFLQHPDRTALVDKLLASGEFDAWLARFLLETTTERRAADYDGFEGSFLYKWFRARLRDRTPYDLIVRKLIASSGDAETQPAVNYLLRNNVNPSELTGLIGRGLLGTTLQCAQCHDHRFEETIQADFWGVAAFFGRSTMFVNDENTDDEVRGVMDVKGAAAGNPEKPEVDVPPRWPGAPPDPAPKGTRRELADYVTKDPLFSRNIVNRLWARLVGRGIVEPLDGFGSRASPTHPELLDALADQFVESGHDLRATIRLIVSSKAYQRSSRFDGLDTPPYASAAMRPLTADQIYRSLFRGTQFQPGRKQWEGDYRAIEERKDGEETVDELSYDDLYPPELLGTTPRTIRRTITLLNDPVIHDAVKAGARHLRESLGKRIGPAHFEQIHWALLSRPPTEKERRQFAGRTNVADLEDVIWAVLNSVEFRNNH